MYQYNLVREDGILIYWKKILFLRLIERFPLKQRSNINRTYYEYLPMHNICIAPSGRKSWNQLIPNGK